MPLSHGPGCIVRRGAEPLGGDPPGNGQAPTTPLRNRGDAEMGRRGCLWWTALYGTAGRDERMKLRAKKDGDEDDDNGGEDGVDPELVSGKHDAGNMDETTGNWAAAEDTGDWEEEDNAYAEYDDEDGM